MLFEDKESGECYPLPEAIDGGEWEVKQLPFGTPHVSLNPRGSGGMMDVPLDESDESRWIRFHEMGHVKYSPKQVKDLPPELPIWLIDAAEDARVNELLVRNIPGKFIPTSQGLTPEDVIQNLKKAQSLGKGGRMYMAALLASKYKTQDFSLINETVLNDINAQREAGVIDEAKHLAMFEEWERLVGDVYGLTWDAITQVSNTKIKNFKKTTIPLAQALFDGFSPEGKAGDSKKSREVEEALKNSPLASQKTNKLDGDGDIPAGGPKWGRMEIKTWAMPRALPPKLKDGHEISADRGTIPVRMERFCSDRQIFRRKVTKHGGAVLIDVSGSMHWSHDELMELVALIPAGIMAVYSGPCVGGEANAYPEGTHNDQWGGLRIVAKNGRAISENVEIENDPDNPGVYRYQSGNHVDGPALDWLAQQKGPKIWVSDGQVVGLTGQEPSLLQYCANVCRKNKILRVDSLREAHTNLKRILTRTARSNA